MNGARSLIHAGMRVDRAGQRVADEERRRAEHAGARPPLVTEPDRGKAIAGAIAAARREDVVLVAGKGHERYQEIAGVRHPFSDAAVSRACLQRWPERVSDPAAAGARA